MVRIPHGPYRYTVAVLSDSGHVFVRPVCPDDRKDLSLYFRGLGSTTAYRRFHGYRRPLSGSELLRLADPNFPAHVGLVATPCGSGAREHQLLAEALYVAESESQTAEMAISVADEHQRRGIGSLLLESLVAWARYAGLVRINADVLACNQEALRFLARHGFRYDRRPVGSICRLFLRVEPRSGHAPQAGQDVIQQ